MKVRRALVGFGIITLVYLIALIWADSRNQVFSQLPTLLSSLPVLICLSFVSYLVRYLRWRWLLDRAGYRTDVVPGYLAYLAGFAFTATPGKVGELLRIRYLAPQGVPPWTVLAAFIYERAFDLIAVLLLATLAISSAEIFLFALGFVLIFLALLVFAALNPAVLRKASAYLRFYRLTGFARLVVTIRKGLSGCRTWATLLDGLLALGSGILAWGLASFSFVWLLARLGESIPLISALAIYPLAMLAGAASMIPGGIGSTEVTIVALLSLLNVSLGTATLAAVGIRLSSLWFAILCGFVSLSILEFRFRRSGAKGLAKHRL
jgi:uncharacterized protein (TIRG00374 family)